MSLNKLGRYDLVRVLGKGAMGVVYEGRDPNLDRRVAIKTVKVENLSEEAAAEYEARFRTEARSAARLQHPNIVSVYDSDRDGDIAFLVMEYIQGDDLKHYLDKGIRYSLEQSLKMVRDLLSALDYAHKQGIIHRDIKPANLLIEPGGRVKLTDFGVARIQNSGEATRTQGSMVGTLKYMSPEQVQGQKIDSRADLFSVGVVLYQLLTDKRPFDGDNDFSIIHQIIGHTPPPPSSFNGRLPSAIDAVVARALAKARDERFATARDFASALQSAIRRAEDATVVPPADPFKKKDGAGTGSRGPRSVTGSGSGQPATSGSTVTQEVELVYWKDIKESTDPEELEGFLEKFPAGIYADLARRRLRKLAAGSGSPEQTVLTGIATAPGGQDLEATRLRSGTSPTHAAAPPQEALASPTEPEAGKAEATEPPAGDDGQSGPADFAPTVAEPHESEPQPSSMPDPVACDMPGLADPAPIAAIEAAPRAAIRPVPASAPAQAPVRRPRLVAVLSAVGALAAVGLAAVMMMGKDSSESATATAPASAPSAAASGVTVTQIVPTVGPGPAPTVAAGADVAKPASAVAAKPVMARRAASTANVQAPTPIVESSQEEHPPPPPPRREERRPVAAPGTPPAPNPAEQCRDKVFLSKEFCLAEQCDKPGARNHPLCVKRREEARLREESKIRY
ncbi:MAG TPA: protein kinase [Ramlibacter sp.]|nr:protein kinase [Ramlibacter sp.]